MPLWRGAAKYQSGFLPFRGFLVLYALRPTSATRNLILFWKHPPENRKLKQVKKTVYLSLGWNLGGRAQNLLTAIEKLGGIGQVVATSSFYETEPVDVTAQPWFLNCAVKFDTEKMP